MTASLAVAVSFAAGLDVYAVLLALCVMGASAGLLCHPA